MALPSAGNPISLQQVNVELDNTATATINMGSTAVRDLFDVSSGAIDMSDGYGKSAVTYYAASGGTESTSGDYKYHTFTGSGTFTVNTQGNAASGNVDYVVVAGGGSSGNDNSSGAGAGGYQAITGATPSASGHPITIGGGVTGNRH